MLHTGVQLKPVCLLSHLPLLCQTHQHTNTQGGMDGGAAGAGAAGPVLPESAKPLGPPLPEGAQLHGAALIEGLMNWTTQVRVWVDR